MATVQERKQCFGAVAPRSATLPVLPSGSHDALMLLEQFGTTILVQRDRQIHDQGEPANYCYKIQSGCVRTVHLTEDGRRQLDEFLMVGGLLGFDAIGTYDFAAEAVTNVVLRRYPRRIVDQLADSNIALMRRLRDTISIGLQRAHARMLLGRKTASERVASFLLEMAERLPESHPHELDLPMTRADIADHLGLTIETVCRVLAHLRHEGTVAIDPADRGRVGIRDQGALQQMASAGRR